MLILTNGPIEDVFHTYERIVHGSALPLSIVIVGVGIANFDLLEKFNDVYTPLYSARSKKYAEADIVQFVPFHEFKSDPQMLARKTLKKIPG